MDTNIIFSAIINGKGLIGDILFNSPSNFQFYSPSFMLNEIEVYHDKLLKTSKLDNDMLYISKNIVLSQINLISEDTISDTNWRKAYNSLIDIDQKDTPFLALALELKGILWTGDKKLSDNLRQLNIDICKTTIDLKQIRGY